MKSVRPVELSSGTFRLYVDRILAEDDVVVVLCTESAQRGSRSWSSPQVHVWTMRDGYAASFRQYQGDQQAADRPTTQCRRSLHAFKLETK